MVEIIIKEVDVPEDGAEEIKVVDLAEEVDGEEETEVVEDMVVTVEAVGEVLVTKEVDLAEVADGEEEIKVDLAEVVDGDPVEEVEEIKEVEDQADGEVEIKEVDLVNINGRQRQKGRWLRRRRG